MEGSSFPKVQKVSLPSKEFEGGIATEATEQQKRRGQKNGGTRSTKLQQQWIFSFTVYLQTGDRDPPLPAVCKDEALAAVMSLLLLLLLFLAKLLPPPAVLTVVLSLLTLLLLCAPPLHCCCCCDHCRFCFPLFFHCLSLTLDHGSLLPALAGRRLLLWKWEVEVFHPSQCHQLDLHGKAILRV